MKLPGARTVSVLIVVVYATAVFLGLRSERVVALLHPGNPVVWAAWKAPDRATIPAGPSGDSIRYGIHLFEETPWYAAAYTGNKLNCNNCHTQGGTAPHASPMVGLPPLFPMYNKRAGHMITLKDRIQECFTRSENGKPLPYDSREMNALVDYIVWLSQKQPSRKPFTGRGLVTLPDLKPDPVHGAQIYASQCAGCHGANGAGYLPQFPPLWGPQAFNDGAGMDGTDKMAAFVQYNMPQNRPGILSPQDAYDVSAFVHAQPHPAFNQAYKNY